jgi:hypothetical protein
MGKTAPTRFEICIATPSARVTFSRTRFMGFDYVER